MTAQIHFSLTRGDDYAATVTFDQAVAAFSEMRFTVRSAWAESQTDNSDADLNVTLTATGTYTALLTLTADQTVALLGPEYVYDIQVTASGKKYTTQRGRLRVDPDATRP